MTVITCLVQSYSDLDQQTLLIKILIVGRFTLLNLISAGTVLFLMSIYAQTYLFVF